MSIEVRIPTTPHEPAAGPVSRSGSQTHDESKVVVKLKRSQEAVGRFRRAAEGRGDSFFERLVKDGHALHVTPIFSGTRGVSRAPSAVIRDVSEEAVRTDRPARSVVSVTVAASTDAHDLARHLATLEAEIDYAFVPAVKRCLAPSSPSVGPDPLRSRQWGHGAVAINLARSRAGFVEADEVVVAVVDSGIDEDHPDLQGGTIHSYTNYIIQEDKRDLLGHGTHVAGIIAAQTNNAVGISGLCRVGIMVVKGLPHPTAQYDPDEFYRALAHPVDEGAQILNLSLGGPFDPLEKELIDEALVADIVVVAAMGNDYEKGNTIEYPAAYPGVIAVGASDELDQRGSFSSTGSHIDLVAPGVRILSTVPTYPTYLTNQLLYDSWPGTSMAAPFVSAAAALLRAKYPALTAVEIAEKLRSTADRVGAGLDHPNDEYGWGRLNIATALI